MPVIVVRKNNTFTVSDLFQWDTDREIEIYGLRLASLPEIHFATSQMSKAIVKQATSYKDGVIRVAIPNVLLETATPIRVFICTHEGEKFISRYSLTINVKARPKPEDYIAEDDEKIYSYNALENLVNDTVINLKAENDVFHEEIVAEVNAICNQLKASVDKTCSDTISEFRNIVENTTISEADTLDGHDAEDFEFKGKPGKTVFNLDGSITTTYTDGSKETIVFNDDGSITTTRNTLELGVKTETTRFNDDGSITVTVE